jgi:hypothetical protein
MNWDRILESFKLDDELNVGELLGEQIARERL